MANSIVVSIDNDGREGLHTVESIRALTKQGKRVLCTWAYTNSIRVLELRAMDGRRICGILRRVSDKVVAS